VSISEYVFLLPGTEKGSVILYSGPLWGRAIRLCTQNCQGQKVRKTPNLQVRKIKYVYKHSTICVCYAYVIDVAACGNRML